MNAFTSKPPRPAWLERVVACSAMLAFVINVSAKTVWLDELDLSRTTQGWGQPQKNLSVGKRAMSISGEEFERGLGTHSISTLEVELNGRATSFSAMVGVDDEVKGKPASVQFSVLGDGKVLWQSPVMLSGDLAKAVEVKLTGVKQLTLAVNDGGDGIDYDHANWVNAKFEVTDGQPVAIASAAAPVRPIDLAKAEIRTPKPPATPRINGPGIFGVRPRHPLLYQIPATGERPMEFSATALPEGLKLDARSGRITGSVAWPGEYVVTLHAKNAKGAAEKKFKIVVGETLALTPPLGWNSWNCWGPMVDADKVLRSAKAMADSGLVQHGWSYINIDDAWQGERGGKFNAIQGNEKFPDMKGLCDQIHAMGLKVGIYSTPWVTSYAEYAGGSAENPEGIWEKPSIPKRGNVNKKILPWAIGKYSFATNDALQWAEWGIDYLKYDWKPNEEPETREMYDALRRSGRDLVFSLSNDTPFDNAPALSKLANCWRTSGDIRDNWQSMSSKGFGQDKWAPYQSPGHWNDPDMLVVGHVGGWGGRAPKPSGLTPDEQYTHITLWCLVAAPLLIGCDMERLDDFTFGLLSNDEVLAVNQDSLGRQAITVARRGDLRIVAKELDDGSKAVGLFNTGASGPARVVVKWSDLGITGEQSVRDLWRQQHLGQFEDEFGMTVAPHGAELVKIQPRRAAIQLGGQ